MIEGSSWEQERYAFTSHNPLDKLFFRSSPLSVLVVVSIDLALAAASVILALAATSVILVAAGITILT